MTLAGAVCAKVARHLVDMAKHGECDFERLRGAAEAAPVGAEVEHHGALERIDLGTLRARIAEFRTISHEPGSLPQDVESTSGAIVAEAQRTADGLRRVWSWRTDAPAAGGIAYITLNSGQEEICYKVTFFNLSAPVSDAHIHIGAEGVRGGVVVPLIVAPAPPFPARPCARA